MDLGLGMPRRVVEAQQVVSSEIQGKRRCSLEVVHQASAKSVCIGMGGMVKKPCLQGLIYPRKSSIYIGMGGVVMMPCLEALTYLTPIKPFLVLC